MHCHLPLEPGWEDVLSWSCMEKGEHANLVSTVIRPPKCCDPRKFWACR